MLYKESDPLEYGFPQFHSSALSVWKALVSFTGISANKPVDEGSKAISFLS